MSSQQDKHRKKKKAQQVKQAAYLTQPAVQARAAAIAQHMLWQQEQADRQLELFKEHVDKGVIGITCSVDWYDWQGNALFNSGETPSIDAHWEDSAEKPA